MKMKLSRFEFFQFICTHPMKIMPLVIRLLHNRTLMTRRHKVKKSSYSEKQIVGILKEVEAGISVAEICRKYGIRRSNTK